MSIYNVVISPTDNVEYEEASSGSVYLYLKTYKYGLLYNKMAVLDPRHITAEGWSVPLINDFKILMDNLGASGNYFSNSVGGNLKETGLVYWLSPNTGAINDVGFNARGAGMRNVNGTFLAQGLGYFTAFRSYDFEVYETNFYIPGAALYTLSDDFTFIYGYDIEYGQYGEEYPRGRSIRIYREATEEEQLLDDGAISATYVGNDGQEYRCTKIGTQVWIADNLAETRYRDSFKINYGILYNWYAVTDVRNIAADGWSVATSAQYDVLIELVKQGLDFDTGAIALKEHYLFYWSYPEGLNTYGFNARGAGSRSYTGAFSSIKTHVYYHSNNDYTGYNTYGLYINRQHDYNVNLKWGNQNNSSNSKRTGMSVRLIKNTTSLSDGETGTYTGNDGKVYRTICIGTQEWLADNLCETKYRNGDDITFVTDNSAWSALTTEGACHYENTQNYSFFDDNIIPEITDNTEWNTTSYGALCAFNNDWSNV